MLSILRKLLPWVRRIFTAIVGGKVSDSARAEELRLERELEELRAFQSGKYTPRTVAAYTAVLVFLLFAIAILADVMFPAMFPGSPVAALEHLLSMGVAMLKEVFSM